MKNRNNLINTIILSFFIPIIFFLYIHSILGTTVLQQFTEWTYYVQDSWWIHLIVFILLILISISLYYVFKNIKFSDRLINWGLFLVTLVYVSLLSLYIWSIKWYPEGDQWDVYDSALQLLLGKYSRWEINGYLSECPNQTGLVLIYTFFHLVFGKNAYLWIQQWNIICYVVSGIFIYKIAGLLFNSRITAISSYLIFLLFLPFACYVTFVYGTIPGFAASMSALYFVLVFLKNYHIKWVFLAGLLISFAYLCKNNYLITFIALLCILLAGGIIERKVKKCTIAMVILILNLFFVITLSHICIKSITGMEVSKGTSAWGFIAMGMQEGNRAPGWFNDYHLSNYREAGRDVELAAENAKIYIKNRIGEFVDQPAYCVEFYSKKISSQWNNPTFQGFWIQQIMSWYREDVPDSVDEWIQDGRLGNNILTYIFNVFQSIVLLGCIVFFFCHKNIDYKTLSLAVIIIGGFLFHMIWEAKCQYTVSYFALLIPYAVQGIVLFGKWLLDKRRLHDRLSKKKGIVAIISIIIVLLIITQNNLVIRKFFKYYTDDAIYQEYITDREGVYHEWQNISHEETNG